MLSPNRLRLYLREFEVLAKKKFGWLGKWFFLQPIWVLNRKHVAGGLGLGVTLAFVPLPIQMLLCVPLSIILRVNLPAALGAVWLSNPLTAAPIFFFALKVGQWVTNRTESWKIITASNSITDLANLMENIWIPLFTGCAICGSAAGISTYLLVNYFWRVQVTYSRKRKKKQQGFKS